MSETTEVTETVFRQYEHVQRSGATNMVMRGKVRDVARELGFDELAEFIEEGDYYEILNNYGEYAEQFGSEVAGAY